MTIDSDKVNLVTIIPEISSFEIIQAVPKNGCVNSEMKKVYTKATGRIDAAAEERQRTGRFLAVGITLVMIFIALYHTVMKHASVLAGLLAPAIIMLLYILWLLYFAKKRKPEVAVV